MKTFKIMVVLKSTHFDGKYSAEIDSGYIVEAECEADALAMAKDEPFYFLQCIGLTFYVTEGALDFNDSTQKRCGTLSRFLIDGETVSGGKFKSQLYFDCEKINEHYCVPLVTLPEYFFVVESTEYIPSIQHDANGDNSFYEIVLCASASFWGKTPFCTEFYEVLIATGYTTHSDSGKGDMLCHEPFGFLWDSISVRLELPSDVEGRVFLLDDQTKRKRAKIIGFRHNQKKVSKDSFMQSITEYGYHDRPIIFRTIVSELFPL